MVVQAKGTRRDSALTDAVLPAITGAPADPGARADPIALAAAVPVPATEIAATEIAASGTPATGITVAQTPAAEPPVTGVAAADAGWVPPTWEEVVRDHSARVYRLAYRLTGNTHDAEDLTQEVFVRVFRSLSSYTPGTFEGWLHRITTNLFLDMARRRQRIRFEGLGDDAAQRLRGDEPTPAQAFDDRHLDGDIQAALKALAPEYRAAVVLCDIQGLSYEEIADTLGVKLGTVRSRIHRGRAQLRAALEHRRPRHLSAAAADQAAPGDPAGAVAATTRTSQEEVSVVGDL